MSLVTLMVAVACNSLVAWFLLPRLVAEHPSRFFFRAWLWANHAGASWGWVPLAGAILAWDYFVWRKYKNKVKGWFTRKLLTFVLAAGFAPILPWWLPAGQPSDKVLSAISSHPGLPGLISWGFVLIVTMLLCIKAETRDLLIGRGKVLCLVSLGALLLVLGMTLVGWSLT